jgi:ribosome-interacting GTPase 1
MGAEQGVMRAVTLTGRGPDTGMLDACVEAMRHQGRVSSAFTTVQDCFTQYGTRPSVGVFEQALRSCVDAQDVYEAQRAVVIAQQVWGAEELAQELEDMLGRVRLYAAERGVSPL